MVDEIKLRKARTACLIDGACSGAVLALNVLAYFTGHFPDYKKGSEKGSVL